MKHPTGVEANCCWRKAAVSFPTVAAAREAAERGATVGGTALRVKSTGVRKNAAHARHVQISRVFSPRTPVDYFFPFLIRDLEHLTYFEDFELLSAGYMFNSFVFLF